MLHFFFVRSKEEKGGAFFVLWKTQDFITTHFIFLWMWAGFFFILHLHYHCSSKKKKNLLFELVLVFFLSCEFLLLSPPHQVGWTRNC